MSGCRVKLARETVVWFYFLRALKGRSRTPVKRGGVTCYARKGFWLGCGAQCFAFRGAHKQSRIAEFPIHNFGSISLSAAIDSSPR